MKRYISIEEYFKKESNNRRKKTPKYIIILCISTIIFSIYIIFKWHLDNYKTKQINKEIKEDININNNYGELINPSNNKNSNYYYYISFPFYQVDFSKLTQKNKDTIAFIYMKNTNINYPVVQTNDNNYYLNHSFDKKENKAGWIFMDYRNNINNLSDNTIIYGHSRIDGTMFGTLKNTLFDTWQNNKDNYIIYLSTPSENMIFQIFSIYTIKSETYYITTTFNNDNEKKTWIETMKKRNIAPIDTEINTNDKVITLSTCKNNRDERIVIQAKLIKKQKR